MRISLLFLVVLSHLLVGSLYELTGSPCWTLTLVSCAGWVVGLSAGMFGPDLGRWLREKKESSRVVAPEAEAKRFKWLLEVEVAETWVEDGFDLDQDRCNDLAGYMVPWAYQHEVKVRVVQSPDRLDVLRAQGYVDDDLL